MLAKSSPPKAALKKLPMDFPECNLQPAMHWITKGSGYKENRDKVTKKQTRKKVMGKGRGALDLGGGRKV